MEVSGPAFGREGRPLCSTTRDRTLGATSKPSLSTSSAPLRPRNAQEILSPSWDPGVWLPPAALHPPPGSLATFGMTSFFRQLAQVYTVPNWQSLYGTQPSSIGVVKESTRKSLSLFTVSKQLVQSGPVWP